MTVLFRPRETMRRVLDSGRDRWTWGIVALAAICSSYGDADVRKITAMPLQGLLAIVTLGLILTAIAWVVFFYAFAWAVTYAGRWLGGEARVAEVRAAVAWGLVPLIWSILYRIPLAAYMSRHAIGHGNDIASLGEFIKQGGCGVVVAILAIQMALYALGIWVMSACVGEACRFSTWKGLGAIAIPAVLPVIAGIAAAIAFKS